MKQTRALKTIEVSMQEIWAHTRPIIQRNKRAYSRKTKHHKPPQDEA